MKYYTRAMERVLLQAVRQFSAIMVTGPRQTGKTTLLKHLFSKTHNYASLDDPDIRLMAEREPKIFLQNFPPPLIIDEIQYVPELLTYLKIIIDKDRSKKGQFLITGSQNFSLMSGVTETLAGRIAIFNLLSFSLIEQPQNDLTRIPHKPSQNFDSTVCQSLLSQPQSLISNNTSGICENKSRQPLQQSFARSCEQSGFKKMVLRGGFPEIALNSKLNERMWFKNYLQTYLERDVRQITKIGNLSDFQRFLSLLSYLDGQVLNSSGISRDLGVAVNTIKNWLSILEASHQIVQIAPFYKNRGKRIVKSPKIYFLDTGLLCFLNNIFYEEQVFTGPLSGALFENVILAELMRWFYNRGESPKIYWWRTSYGEEVDFIVEVGNKIVPIEIKLTGRANKEIVKNLDSFCSLFKSEVQKGLLISLVGERLQISDNVEIVPVEEFVNDRFLSTCFGV